MFTADKCGPGALNFPLWAVFTSPMYCAGLMLPKMKQGFRFTVIDMEHAEGDRVIELDTPERHIDLAVLLRDENRFGIQSIHSRAYPDQKIVAVSTDRLHTIAGEYKGKDDPVAIVRSQGVFPAPEEIVSPYVVAHLVAGERDRKVLEEGDMEAGIWSAGMVAGLIRDIPTCEELVHRIVSEAADIINKRLSGFASA